MDRGPINPEDCRACNGETSQRGRPLTHTCEEHNPERKALRVLRAHGATCKNRQQLHALVIAHACGEKSEGAVEQLVRKALRSPFATDDDRKLYEKLKTPMKLRTGATAAERSAFARANSKNHSTSLADAKEARARDARRRSRLLSEEATAQRLTKEFKRATEATHANVLELLDAFRECACVSASARAAADEKSGGALELCLAAEESMGAQLIGEGTFGFVTETFRDKAQKMIEDAEAVEAACLEFEAKPWAPKATTATPPPPPKPAPKQRKVVCDSDDGGPSSGDEWNPEKVVPPKKKKAPPKKKKAPPPPKTVAASDNTEALILELLDVLGRCPAAQKVASTDAALEVIAAACAPEAPPKKKAPVAKCVGPPALAAHPGTFVCAFSSGSSSRRQAFMLGATKAELDSALKRQHEWGRCGLSDEVIANAAEQDKDFQATGRCIIDPKKYGSQEYADLVPTLMTKGGALAPFKCVARLGFGRYLILLLRKDGRRPMMVVTTRALLADHLFGVAPGEITEANAPTRLRSFSTIEKSLAAHRDYLTTTTRKFGLLRSMVVASGLTAEELAPPLVDLVASLRGRGGTRALNAPPLSGEVSEDDDEGAPALSEDAAEKRAFGLLKATGDFAASVLPIVLRGVQIK